MNRQQRRNAYKSMGILKNKSSRQFNDPTRKEISKRLSEEGKSKHLNFTENQDRINSEKLEHKLAEYKKQLKIEGWNEEEIKLLEEAWSIRAVKNKETYQQDKKAIKELIKKAEASKKARS